jgi:hypothetical protein
VIHVEPVEPTDERWCRWRQEADAAAQTLDSESSVNEELYKRCRDFILERFHKKCAYCETRVDTAQQFGDVEHFRPKGPPTDEYNQPVFTEQRKPHPGYFWLAYEWLNLMPACISCNRPGTHPDGTKAGKWNRFPVKGPRAAKRGDPLDPDENRLLLNPYLDVPEVDLIFDPDTGIVAPRTERGATTINVLGLNREGLRDARKRAAQSAKDHYSAFLEAVRTENERERARRKEEVQSFREGRAEYSAIGCAAILQVKDLMETALRE